MQKKSLVIANWKMELSHKATLETVEAVRKLLKGFDGKVDLVVCPSFPSLPGVSQMLKRSSLLQVGAQNVHWEERGAWTGEVSVYQIKPFAEWCIVGHSERRLLTQESDEQVSQKAELLIRHGLTPIVCVGETADLRAAGQTVEAVTKQITSLFDGLTRVTVSRTVIAYEPVWAIGSGETPAAGEVSEVMLLIRKLAAERFGGEIVDRLRVIYGGSVGSDNAVSFAAEPGIDGVLVGGASLRPMQFISIAKVFSK